MNTANGSVVGCEIELPDGRLCGILAIGRCATCGRAFCPTHQAWMAPTHYVDQCAPCLAAKRTEASRRWQEAQIPYEYFKSGTARTALLASGVPPVDIYKIRREWKTGLFGLGGRDVDVATPVGYGWILGTFKWASRWGHYDLQKDKDVVIGEDCLTALLDLSHDDPRYSEYRSTCGLVPVRPYSRGYEALKGVFKGNQQAEDLDSWREIAQAVRRLTGGTS